MSLASVDPSPPITPPLDPVATSPSTLLVYFPTDATLHIWRKPPTGIEPINGDKFHIAEVILGDGDFLLVCFATMATDDWQAIREQLSIGKSLGLKPLLVGAVDGDHIKSALWGVGPSAGVHGVTNKPNHETVFTPSLALMKILGINRSATRTHNALVLIRQGRVVASWVSEGDTEKRHNWTQILAYVD